MIKDMSSKSFSCSNVHTWQQWS